MSRNSNPEPDDYKNIHVSTFNYLRKTKPASITRRFRETLLRIDISEHDRTLFVDRFLREICALQTWIKRLGIFRRIGNSYVMVSSVVTPALVSINHVASDELFWSVFATSLSTGIISAFLSLFSVESRELAAIETYNQLVSEGFTFLELSGPYAQHVTHSDAINTFWERVENTLNTQTDTDLALRKNAQPKPPPSPPKISRLATPMTRPMDMKINFSASAPSSPR